MSDLPLVSIAFPNFNGGHFLIEVIRSLLDQSYPEDRRELILVDNGSTDQSVQRVQEAFPEKIRQGRLRILELDLNQGAPAAYNRGIQAMSSPSRYLLKMDNDIVLEPNCLERMVRYAEEHPSVGMVGARVRYFWDRKRLHLIGSRVNPWFGACIGIGKAAVDHGEDWGALPVQAVNGCLMLVRRSLIDRIGPMEESFFLYFDDIDWALRASRAGFQHRVLSQAIAYHNTSSPRDRFTSTRWGYFNPRNTCLLAKRNFTPYGQWICWVVLSLKVLLLAGLVISHNRRPQKRRAVLRALWQGYRRGTSLLFSGNGLPSQASIPEGVLGG